MKRIVLALLTLAASAFFTACGDQGLVNKPTNAAANNTNNASPAVNPAAVETDIKKLMTDAAAALSKNDADAMDKIYADNYMLVNIDGSLQTKAERLASLRSGETKYDSFAYDDINVRSNPEGTGAISIARLTMKGTMRGKPVDGTFRVTQVYSKTKDGWKQVSAQATKIEGGPAAAKTDSNAKPDDKAKPDIKNTNEKMKPTATANK